VGKYCEEDGMSRMLLDLMVASEIQDQIEEASKKSQSKDKKPTAGDAKGMVARMQQRRAQRLKESSS